MKTRVLIAFHSRSGTTAALARAIAEGAEAEEAEVRLRRAREVVPAETMARAEGWAEAAAAMNALYPAPDEADADWADGIVFGSPTRFGAVAAELKSYIDSLGGLWLTGRLAGKAGSAFSTTMSAHGGNEATILSLYPTMAHFGLVIVPTGYADPSAFAAGTPYGATSVGLSQPPRLPLEADLAAARYQGRRVTRVARALRGLRA